MGMSGEAQDLEVDCAEDEVLVKQDDLESSDINTIIARCLRTGGATDYVSRVAPVFADVTGFGSFADSVRRVDEVHAAFMMLPAKVRTKFDNSPVALLEFISDPKNRAEAIELGLVVKPAEPASAPKAPVPPDPGVVGNPPSGGK